VAAKTGQFTSDETGKCPVLPRKPKEFGRRGSCEKDFVSKKSSELFAVLLVYLLSCKLPRPGDSEVIFSVFESSCHPVTTSLTTQRSIPLSALPKDTTSELAAYLDGHS